MIKHCASCGKEFDAENNYIKLCSECSEKGKIKRKEDNLGRMKERKKELGLRTTCLYAKDIDLLKKIKDKKETLADAFHVILKLYIDNKKHM